MQQYSPHSSAGLSPLHDAAPDNIPGTRSLDPHQGEIPESDASSMLAAEHGRTRSSRISVSCDLCHKRKIKCDAGRPSCSNCRNVGAKCQTLRALAKRGRKSRKRQSDLQVSQDSAIIDKNLPSPAAYPAPEASGDYQVRETTSTPSYEASNQTYHHESGPHVSCNQEQNSPRCLITSVELLPISPRLPSAVNYRFHPLLQNLAKDLADAGVSTPDVISYMGTCLDLFVDHIYPIYPIIYQPHLRQYLEDLQYHDQYPWEPRSFMLLSLLCAYILAVLPMSISGAPWCIAEAFYSAFKNTHDQYPQGDVDHPTSSSVAIHLLHAAWQGTSGNSRASWYILGNAMRTSLLMGLHDEKSYEKMSPVEAQLCRRAFWALYTGDKAASLLGGHPMTFGKSLFWGFTVPRYPESLGPEDEVTVKLYNGRRETLDLLVGFNANQDIWRAAEDLLLAEREDMTNDLNTSDIRFHTTAAAFRKFRTILDKVHNPLRFYYSLDTSLDGFYFADQHDHRPQVPQALAAQRTNLHISYQYLKVVFLRKYPSHYFNDPRTSDPAGSIAQPLSLTVPSQTEATATTSAISTPSSSTVQGRSNFQSDHCQLSFGLGLVRETMHIAEDMLYIIHTSSLQSLRVNGEPCIEKIRYVAASVLEVLAQGIGDTALRERALKFRDLYPHLLARLESKASDDPKLPVHG
ncbi:uncharacterized protein BKA55DRAFT_617082 [Fusarium redolens]|uniref:Zn(2)-C6 fungal-type domain-containing protein n=1 Tax=Fusarium redolens TaxID=48865 RepID=A0A9P9GXM3_FUSRE|nr:uncharacterized protein BKA55DRAFT_617082 [Fusarium redolens]KAH7247285.1 hypothetical protein BKA55DRAFT_617082 [Fusarium redolens]